VYCRELVLEDRNFFKTPLGMMRRLVLARAELVVAVDSGLQEYFKKEAGREVHLIPISVNLVNFEIKPDVRRELGLLQGDRLVLYLGNLSSLYLEGLGILLNAFGNVNKETRNTRLVIGGKATASSDGMAYLNHVIEKLKLNDAVTFLPWLPYSVIPSLIRTCDICVDPNTKPGTDEFQVGTKLLEYMAAGKPVLAMNVTGNRFIIEDGINGLLAEPDVADFSAKLGRLLNDAELAKRLGANARNTMETLYDSKVVAARFEELLSAVVARK
jgi:glycosyltransferase involved in cell wall biosynthesis